MKLLTKTTLETGKTTNKNMKTETQNKTELIEKLISIASERAKLDKRRKNRGRPKIGFKDDSAIVSKMRQRGISLRNIHGVLRQYNLTNYKHYGTFQQAWKSYLAD